MVSSLTGPWFIRRKRFVTEFLPVSLVVVPSTVASDHHVVDVTQVNIKYDKPRMGDF